jgi:hypothetical protein
MSTITDEVTTGDTYWAMEQLAAGKIVQRIRTDDPLHRQDILFKEGGKYRIGRIDTHFYNGNPAQNVLDVFTPTMDDSYWTKQIYEDAKGMEWRLFPQDDSGGPLISETPSVVDRP